MKFGFTRLAYDQIKAYGFFRKKSTEKSNKVTKFIQLRCYTVFIISYIIHWFNLFFKRVRIIDLTNKFLSKKKYQLTPKPAT